MTDASKAWPVGGSEMAERIRALNWAATPLGSPGKWSPRFRLAIELMLDTPLIASLVCGPSRTLVYNDAAARLYGAAHPQALGKPLPDAFPQGWATVCPFYDRAFGGEAVHVEAQPLDTRGDGAHDMFDAWLVPVRDDSGAVSAVAMTGFVLGADARAEAARREIETRNRLLMESRTQAVWETDATGVVVSDSPSWRAFTGQTLAEWMGYGWLDAIHPDDRAYAERQWRETVAVKGLVDAQFRLRAPNGSWRWTNVRAAPLLDKDGRIEKWVGMNIDIDARVRAEAKFREDEERQSFLLKLSDAIGSLFDPVEIKAVAVRLLAEQLGINRAFYADADSGRWIVAPGHEHGIQPLPTTTFAMSDYGDWIIDDFRAGRRLIVEDMTADPRFTPEQRAANLSLGIHSVAALPLVKAGELVAMLTVQSSHTRIWSPTELLLVGETAERTWSAVERARAEAAMQESEERFRSLFETMGQAYVLLDIVRDVKGAATDVRILELNPAYGRLMGVSAEEARGHCVYQLFPEVDRWWLETCDRVARAGAPERVEHRYSEVGDWFECWLYPRGGNRIEALFEQITERKHAEAALRGSEERQAFLLKLSDTIRPFSDPLRIQAEAARVLGEQLGAGQVGYAEADASGEYVTIESDWNDGTIPSNAGRHRLEAFGPAFIADLKRGETIAIGDVSFDPRTSTEQALATFADASIAAFLNVPLIKAGRLVAVLAVHSRTPRNWATGDVEMALETAERTWAAVERTRAEAALRESERRLQVLVAELQHRVRNILTVIRSVFTRTANTNEDRDELVRHFEGRVSTLARTHVMVTRTADGTALLEDLIRDELLAAAASDGPKLTIEGPEVELDARTVETLSLAIHELTTNALKYGALAHPSGILGIAWKIDLDQRGVSWLHIDWVEQGVPILAVAPRRVGFGRELIEEVLPYQLKAETTLEFRGGGIRCLISLPLTEKDNGAAK